MLRECKLSWTSIEDVLLGARAACVPCSRALALSVQHKQCAPVDVTMFLGCYMATRPRRAPCPRLQLVVLVAGG